VTDVVSEKLPGELKRNEGFQSRRKAAFSVSGQDTRLFFGWMPTTRIRHWMAWLADEGYLTE
jgi:hypothetical protein